MSENKKKPPKPESSGPLSFSVNGRKIDGQVQAGVIHHLTQHFHISSESGAAPDNFECRPAGGEFNPVSSPEPAPRANPGKLIRPGGPLDVNSRIYIKRDTDEDVIDELSRPRGLVTVQAPRQSGKTSLMLRIHVNAKEILEDEGIRPVFLDFQALPGRCFESLETIWRTVAQEIGAQLEIAHEYPGFWNGDDPYDRNMNGFLDRCVFKTDKSPVLLCFDEVDRMFTTPVKTEFFSSIRAFYGRSAFDPAWRAVRWLLNTSSEPAFFIDDINQSPFNIGEYIRLRPFTAGEVLRLARCHGFDPSPELLDRIQTYLGGRPYLTHLLFYRMAKAPDQWERFFDGATGGGIFLKHLKRYLKQFQKDSGLAEAFKQVIRQKGCKKERLAERLEAAGLVKRDTEQNVICACDLYAQYFARMLK